MHEFLRSIAGGNLKVFVPSDKLKVLITDIENTGKTLNNCFGKELFSDFFFQCPF